MMKKKWINFLLFCTTSIFANAQIEGYSCYTNIDSVSTAGFYNIILSPQITAHLKTDYSDIRIINSKNKWVPHVLNTKPSNIAVEELMVNLKFVVANTSNSNTEIIINTNDSITSKIGLLLGNSLAKRYCTLSGSNDYQNWFVINDSILINPEIEENKTSSIFKIDFPPGNYKFLKIVIHNNNKDPFNIKNVFEFALAEGPNIPVVKFINNPNPGFKQKDSGKVSIIKIIQQSPFHFDRINFSLSGVKYFNRKADLLIASDENKSSFTNSTLLKSIIISNNSTLDYSLPVTNAQILYLCIYNEDNLPLKVDEVKTQLQQRFITTYLEKGNSYKLLLDNNNAVTPTYDLVIPDSLIKNNAPVLNTGTIEYFTKQNLLKKEKSNKWILWLAIAIVLTGLAYFTKKMIREVNIKKQHDNL